ncbi:helix-turn-helix domain-containing protein [uncultured Algibacter sp.]|uniref:helix-turn-helix domain-containing protein n=1 Tax=uncultured Algibacter sp. TaxID=298659 RepID=UPI0032166308
MSKRKAFKVVESLEEIKKLRSKQFLLYKARRLLWLQVLKEPNKITRERSSKKSGISLRTQERWIERYNSGGIEGLLNDAPNLKKSKIITQEIHQGLSKRVNSSDNPFLGYWDAKDWILSEYGVDITYHWIRAYLIKHLRLN